MLGPLSPGVIGAAAVRLGQRIRVETTALGLKITVSAVFVDACNAAHAHSAWMLPLQGHCRSPPK